MKNKNAKIVFIWIMLILLIVGQTSVVFAGKPTNPPVTTSALDITTQNLTFDVMENGSVNFTVSATLKSDFPVVWSTVGTNAEQVLFTGATRTAKVAKRSTTYVEAAKYTFTPLNTNKDQTYTYTIQAFNSDVNKDSITVTFRVKAVSDLIPGPYVYVALGDSIPYGTSYEPLFGPNPTVSYTDKFYNYLKTKYVSPTYIDYSMSGDTSGDLLSDLYLADVQTAVTNADVITLCIGSNDIMDAANRIPLLIGERVDFYDVDIDIANAGRASFEANWPSIIQMINALNPDVQLLVMTLYNPYNNNDLGTNTHIDTDHTTPMYTLVNQYFWNESTDALGLNTIITNYPINSVTLKYKVVDVYGHFETYYGDNKGAVTGFYNNWVQDPHPDANGQNVIFELHKTAYERQ